MAETTPNAAVITRLGYDPTDLKRGLEQARQDVAKYKEAALRTDAELRRERLKNATEFSRENRRQVEEQIVQQRTLIAQNTAALRGLRGAQKAAAVERLNELKAEFAEMKRGLGLFDEQKTKVIALQRAQMEASIAAKRSQLAAGLFTQAGPGLPQQIADAFRTQVFEAMLMQTRLGGALQGGLGAAKFAGGGALLGAGLFGAVAIPLALKEIGGALHDTAMAGGEYAHNLTLVSERSGIALGELQKFEAVGRTVGLTAEDMARSMKFLSAAIVGGGGEEGLQEAGTKGAKILAALGIASHDNLGKVRSFGDVLLDLSDVFRQLPDGAEKVRLAVDLLGRSGQNWIPLLNKGREGVRQFLADVQDFIPDLGGAAHAFEALEVAQAKYDLAMLGLKTRISEEVLPVISGFVTGLSALLTIWKELGASGVLQFLATGKVGEFPAKMQDVAKRLGEGNLQFAPGVSPEAFTSLQFPARAFLSGVRSPGSKEDERLAAGLEFMSSKIKDFNRLTLEAQTDAVALGVLLLEGKVKEAGQEKKISDELENRLKKLREVWAGDKEAAEAKRTAAQLADAEARDVELLAERQKAVSDAARKTADSENELLNLTQQRLEVVDAELAASLQRERAARQAAGNEKLSVKERLDAQKRINEEVEKSIKLIREQGELSKSAADTLQKLISQAVAGPLTVPGRGALSAALAPAPHAVNLRDFQSELADLRVQEALSANVVNQELAIRRDLNLALIEQIKLRLASGVATDKERQELEKLLGELKQNREEMSRASSTAFKQSTFGQFLDGMQKISDIVGKFAPSLSRGLGQVFAAFELFKSIGDQLRLLGGGTLQGGQVVGGSALAGLQGIFTGRGPGTPFTFGTDVFGTPTVSGGPTQLTPGQRINAAMQLIAGIAGGIGQWRQGGTLNRTLGGATVGGTAGFMAGGPIGAAIGAIIGAALGAITSTQNRGIGGLAGFALGGPIGAIFGFRAAGARKQTANIEAEIIAQIKAISNAFASGEGNLKDTIAGLERERADAITRLTGRKGGGSDKAKKIVEELDKQLAVLRRQQKDILEAFSQNLGLLQVADGAREAAQSIAEMAATLKEAADAGASLDQQTRFLNLSLDELKKTTGQALRDDEQETIDLLLRDIDLQKQRADIVKQAADAELAVKQKLGLGRILTPAQQAAQEIKSIRDQRDEKLASLDEEAARLKAQIEGRAELFGFSSAETVLQGERNDLLARQLELERSITAEIIARIREQQAIFASLAAGLIPSLPAGILPSGFAVPAGAQYNFPGNITIQVVLPNGADITPREAAAIFRAGVAEAAARRNTGFES